MNLLFILEKNNLVEGYFPNCSLGNWKKPFFSLFARKEPGLSQKVLIKISLKK